MPQEATASDKPISPALLAGVKENKTPVVFSVDSRREGWLSGGRQQHRRRLNEYEAKQIVPG
jgi:hypothetical protein